MKNIFLLAILFFSISLYAEDSGGGINSQGVVAIVTGLALVINEAAESDGNQFTSGLEEERTKDRRAVILGVGALAFIGATIYESNKKDKKLAFAFGDPAPALRFSANF